MVHKKFEELARSNPHTISLIHGSKKINYEQLNSRSNRLANHLSYNLQPEEVVGIYMHPSVDQVTAVMGVLKAGGAFLLIDPSLPVQKIQLMLSQCGCSKVIITEQLPPTQINKEIALITITNITRNPGIPHNNPKINLSPTNLAYIIFTSGSTGVPKGVMIEHGSLTNHMNWRIKEFAFTAKDVFIYKTATSFDACVWEFFGALMVGGTLVIAGKEDREDLDDLVALIEDHQVTVLQVVPSMLKALQQILTKGNWLSLRLLFTGGEELTPRLCQKHHQLLKAELVNLYGPAEATIDASFFRVNPSHTYQRIPIGKAVSNTELLVLDEAGNPLKLPGKGILSVKGACVGRGYINDPETTAKSFLESESGGRIYSTGDHVELLPDGNLVYLGRNDNQIKINGQRLALEEVEFALMKHPDISEVACFYHKDGIPPQLYAVTVCSNRLTLEQLCSFLQDYLPEYAHPQSLIQVGSLPLNANGKIDRKNLVHVLPEVTKTDSDNNQISIDHKFLGILTELLGSIIDPRHNLIRIGGTSLTAMQLRSRLKRAFGHTMDIQALLHWPINKIDDHLKLNNGANQILSEVKVNGSYQTYPLSMQQLGIWLEGKIQKDDSLYHEPTKIVFSQKWTFEQIGELVSFLIRSHPGLRTVLVKTDLEPQQRIDSELPLDLQRFDLNGLESSKIQELEYSFLEKPFDYYRGPLVRFGWFYTNSKQYMIMVIHHLITDQWSLNLLLKSIGRFCQNPDIAQEPIAGRLSSSYGHYVHQQLEWSELSTAGADMEFWQQYLQDADFNIPLGANKLRAADSGHTQYFNIDQQLEGAVRKLAINADATLYTFFLAVFKLLLFRYTTHSDLSVLTPVSDRHQPEYESEIGFFVNTLLVRTNLEGNKPFIYLLQSVKESLQQILSYTSTPYPYITRKLKELGREVPDARVMFVMQDMTAASQALESNLFHIEHCHSRTSKFDLTFFIYAHGDRLEGGVEYSTEVFDRPFVNGMIEHFKVLLHAIVERSETPIEDLPLITEKEHYQLITSQYEPWLDYPKDQCLHELFQHQAEETPDNIAIAFYHQQISYKDLNILSNQIANLLLDQGISRESRVGICMDRSIEMVACIWGILKAGCAYVALDPDYPKERLNYMANDSQVNILLSDSKHVNMFDPDNYKILAWDLSVVKSYTGESPGITVNLNDLAYVIYTSGSTGTPKGVLIEHRALPSLITERINDFGLGPGQSVLQFMSLSFDASLWEIALALCSGARLCMCNKEDLVPGSSMIDLLNQWQITCATFPPSVLNYLDPHLLPTLEVIIVTGESCPPSLLEKWAKSRRLYNGYGPSESTIGATIGRLSPDEPVHIGQPFKNYRVFILDKNLKPLPSGVSGEIFIGGIGLARGYQNLAEDTRIKFIPDPFKAGSRLFKTGDFGNYNYQGNIEFQGRLDRMVKIRGVRIELEEIERAISSHQLVLQALVEVQEYGDNHKRILAFITWEGTKLSDSELRAYLAVRIPQHMIPAVFISLSEVPKTANGKIDRKMLPMPDPSDINYSGEGACTALEQIILDIFRKVLQTDQIGTSDNFFDAGGHSLMVFQLIKDLDKATGIKVRTRIIFDHPTVTELAEYLSANYQLKTPVKWDS